jgi:hypothetical protein
LFRRKEEFRMKQDITRRDLFKLAAASAAVLASGTAMGSKALAGTVDFVKGGKDFSPKTGMERKMIPWWAMWRMEGSSSWKGILIP